MEKIRENMLDIGETLEYTDLVCMRVRTLFTNKAGGEKNANI